MAKVTAEHERLATEIEPHDVLYCASFQLNAKKCTCLEPTRKKRRRIALAIAEAEERQREKDCLALCSMCEEAKQGSKAYTPALLDEEGDWVHLDPATGKIKYPFLCRAAAIRKEQG